MNLAYRTLDVALERKLATLDDEGPARAAAARRVYARRVGRAAAGLTGLGFAVATFVDAALRMIGVGLRPDPTGQLTPLILCGWAAAPFAYGVARLFAGRRFDALLARPLVRTGDAARDLALLETGSPGVVARQVATGKETASVALPMMALSFLAPLTLHLLVALLVGWVPLGERLAERYDEWISMSVAIVGHAHLALALWCWRWAVVARRTATEELRTTGAGGWPSALGVATLCGIVPGVVFFAIPPILAVTTGLVFIPAMYIVMRKRILSERAALAS